MYKHSSLTFFIDRVINPSIAILSLHRYVVIGGTITPRCIAGSVPPRDKILTVVPIFFGGTHFSDPTPTVTGFLYPEIQNGDRKQEVVSVVPSLLMSERR